jgi:dynein heavy chain
MLMELRYTELEERYRTRLLYALTPPEQEQRAAELADAQNLRVEWQQLTAAAEELDAGLYAVKAKFRDTTRQQVSGEDPTCMSFLH